MQSEIDTANSTLKIKQNELARLRHEEERVNLAVSLWSDISQRTEESQRALQDFLKKERCHFLLETFSGFTGRAKAEQLKELKNLLGDTLNTQDESENLEVPPQLSIDEELQAKIELKRSNIEVVHFFSFQFSH